MILFFLLCIGLLLAKDTPFFNFVSQTLGQLLSFFNLGRGYQGQHYAGARDRSYNSFNTAIDRSSRLESSRASLGRGDAKNFYAQVRDRINTSPDAKVYHNQQEASAPINRFQQSRGSVVSPNSMYRRPDSIYRDSHY